MHIILVALLVLCNPCCGEWFAYDRAIADAQRQDYNAALKRLNTSIADDPDNPSLLYDAGVVSYRSGDYKQAQDYFKRAAQIKNNKTSLQKQAYFNLGNACCVLKEYKDAVDANEQSLKLDPHDERVQHNLKKARELLEAQKREQEQEKKNQQQKQQEKKSEQNKDADSSKQQDEQRQQNQI